MSCALCVVCGTIKIVGIFLQTKEKYADLLKGSFFLSRRMWRLKRDTRKNALLRLLAWTRTESGRASCFIIPSPLCYRFPIFLRASVPAVFGFLRSALFCGTYFHTFTEQFVVVRATYVSVLALFGVETYRLGQVVCRTVFVNLGYSYHFPPIVEE